MWTQKKQRKKKLRLYKDNKKLVVIMVLGQGSDHGLAVIKKTKSTDYPSRFAWRIVGMMMKRNKPNNACAEIELDAEPEKVKFSTAPDYYNEVVAVMARFDVTRLETELIRMMAKKVSSSMFVKLIIEHLQQIIMTWKLFAMRLKRYSA